MLKLILDLDWQLMNNQEKEKYAVSQERTLISYGEYYKSKEPAVFFLTDNTLQVKYKDFYKNTRTEFYTLKISSAI
jgi:hypothetical protein